MPGDLNKASDTSGSSAASRRGWHNELGNIWSVGATHPKQSGTCTGHIKSAGVDRDKQLSKALRNFALWLVHPVCSPSTQVHVKGPRAYLLNLALGVHCLSVCNLYAPGEARIEGVIISRG